MHVEGGRCRIPSCRVSDMQQVIERYAEQIRAAAADKRPLRLRGGGSKDFYGQSLEGEVLDTRAYAGIVAYEPTELVITARCGTPLAELEAALRARGPAARVRAAAFRPRRDRGRHGRRRPVRAAARRRRARCAISCSACACSTGAATISASAAR